MWASFGWDGELQPHSLLDADADEAAFRQTDHAADANQKSERARVQVDQRAIGRALQSCSEPALWRANAAML